MQVSCAYYRVEVDILIKHVFEVNVYWKTEATDALTIPYVWHTLPFKNTISCLPWKLTYLSNELKIE